MAPVSPRENPGRLRLLERNVAAPPAPRTLLSIVSRCCPGMRPNIINPEMSSRSDTYSQCVQGGNFMRMSLMFAAVTLLTGINLLFILFQPVPALWGGILAVAFILMNVLADKLRLWSGIAWIIIAGIIIALMLKGKEPGDELRVLITVFAFLASAWYSIVQYRKERHFRS